MAKTQDLDDLWGDDEPQSLPEGESAVSLWEGTGARNSFDSQNPDALEKLGIRSDRDDLERAVLASASAEGDAFRLLYEAAPRLLVAYDLQDSATIYVDNGGGVWRPAADKNSGLAAIYARTLSGWEDALHRAAKEGRITNKSAHVALSHWKSANTPEGYNRALKLIAWHAREPMYQDLGVTICRSIEINSNRAYIGAPNGVIDLNTGRLLSPEAGRSKLVTQSLPDPFDPYAQHKAVPALLRHLPRQHRKWLLDAVGFALRGIPSRRFYFLIGEGGGGKSTALEAIRKSLGNEYAGGIPEGALQSRTVTQAGIAPQLVPFQTRRVMVGAEPKGRISAATVKILTGGDSFEVRKPYGELLQGPATATMFIALNPGKEPPIDLTDDALYDRLKVTPWPSIPEAKRDVDFGGAFNDEAARQAMVALIVEHAVGNAVPPEDTPDGAELRESIRLQHGGEAIEWIKENVLNTSIEQDHIGTGQLFAAAQRAAEVGAEGKPWGYERTAFTKLAATVLSLPRTMTVRVNGKPTKGWKGWRLATPEELEANEAEASQPELSGARECGRCGETFLGEGDVCGLCKEDE